MNKLMILLAFTLLFSCKNVKPPTQNKIAYYVTLPDKSLLLEEQNTVFEPKSNASKVEVDATIKYQEIDGFGFTLTEGSAWAIHQKLNETQQNELLEELFSPQKMNFSFLRVTIGASDMNHFVYTYADDNLENFTLKEDQKDIIPILKKIIKINPNIKIMGSPWTAPKWMKTNNSYIGGALKPEYYATYAQYFVKYISAMKAEGIPVFGITIQNEPENPKNNPSMVMTAEEQADFIKNHLGNAFKEASSKTKIITFDHNCDHPIYPITILKDSLANPYVDGSAFHLYVGDISALTTVHDAFPNKNIYFTEQWNWTKGQFAGDLSWGVKNLTIGATRNWAKSVLQWNLASDQNFYPYTDMGGCNECLPAVTVHDDGSITRNVAYYTLGHAAKFLPLGSVRIASSSTDNEVQNVAFLTPEGKKVLILLNLSKITKSVSIKSQSNEIPFEIKAGAVVTVVF